MNDNKPGTIIDVPKGTTYSFPSCELYDALQNIINTADSPEADGGECWWAGEVSQAVEKARPLLEKFKHLRGEQ